jgi:two-component system sensor histidine kinase KdpD
MNQSGAARDDERPDPDALLESIQKREARQQRGKLKIFLGMAAGVGKTYAMLEAAHQLKAEGIDVVIGYVETHGRAETEELLHGLPVIPRLQIDYRGTQLEEMDMSAILERKPQVVLVDELAHTNVPNVRHVKRYQDVQELLEFGITVYTTVNVQHFESRADTVRQITGITVHETVPDSILDLADEIALIDLSPEELRKRLAEGKVYTVERIEIAAKNFFRIGNLTALREMALRLTAERVDHQLQDYMSVKRIAGPWKSSERLMVAVSASPLSEQLIRWTRRMAYNLEAPWLAAHVETPNALTTKQKARLAKNLALARQLGGEVIVTAANNIGAGLLRLAQQRNITQIVVGKPLHNIWQSLLRGGSLVDHLIRESGNIDIYVVTSESSSEPPVTLTLPSFQQHSRWVQYILAAIIIGVMTFFNLLLLPIVGYSSIGLIELFAVLLIAIYIGRGPALLAAVISTLSWNYLFITPRFTFSISRPEDVILFLLYFAIAILGGNLTARLRTQEQQARTNAERTMAMYALAHETANAINMDDVLRTAVNQLERVFDARVAIILAEDNILATKLHPCSHLTLSEKELSVALWAFQNGKPAGRFTDTLPSTPVQFLPLNTGIRTLGVIGIQTRQTERLSFDQEVMLETFVSQIALAVERELLDKAAEQTAMMQESERLYTTLLNSISHELRTPIATIMGASSSLMALQTNPSQPYATLVGDIQDAAERLNRLVENLLDMSRLDSGRLNLKLDWCDMREVISAAARHLKKCLVEHPVTIQHQPNLPLVQVDFVLMEQVIINLLDNICQHTPPQTPIQITTAQEGQHLKVWITDYGQGIPPEDLERIFEKFYRSANASSGGTGLGLSVCRGLVEAHGGRLTAQNMAQGGAQFTLSLPISAAPPPVQEAAL